MHLYLNTAVMVQIVSTLITLAMAVFVYYHLLRGKKAALLHCYAICQSLLFIWAASELLEAWTVTRAGKWLVYQLQFFPICFIGVTWLLLCLYFTGSRLVADWRKIAALLAPSLGLYLLVLTNDSHHLYFTVFEYEREVQGAGFWLNAVLSYGYVLLGVLLLWKYSLDKYHAIKLSFILLTLASLCPVLANLLFLTQDTPLTYGATPILYDITPNSFSITVTLFTIAIARYRFLNIWPLAVQAIVHHLKEAILVVDGYDTVVNCNEEFRRLFPAGPGRPMHLAQWLEDLQSKLADRGQTEAVGEALRRSGRKEIELELRLQIEGQYRWFAMNIRPMPGEEDRLLGRIITLRDISSHKKLLLELNLKNVALESVNRELLGLNHQLTEYAAAVEELTITAERNRYARDMHDSLGNTMVLLIKMLEAGIISCAKDGTETERQLREAVKVAREGWSEFRKAAMGLMPERLESDGLKLGLERLLAI
jgi:PAS domain S-box-containing protein